ncbi:hypothetical protein CR513_33914, partial [Mucuna pruriens]
MDTLRIEIHQGSGSKILKQCDNVIYTLINEKDKRKDHVEARKDLQAMGIRRELWPPDDGKKEEINVILKTLKDISVLDGYSSNISRCVDILLPLAIRNVLPVQVATILVDLCAFFKLCAKVLSHNELDRLKT